MLFYPSHQGGNTLIHMYPDNGQCPLCLCTFTWPHNARVPCCIVLCCLTKYFYPVSHYQCPNYCTICKCRGFPPHHHLVHTLPHWFVFAGGTPRPFVGGSLSLCCDILVSVLVRKETVMQEDQFMQKGQTKKKRKLPVWYDGIIPTRKKERVGAKKQLEDSSLAQLV